MLGGYVQAALAVGLAAGDEAEALRAQISADPLVRWRTRRAVGRALLTALAASGDAAAGGADGTAHGLRAAALIAAGTRGVDLTSRDAVERAHARLPKRTPTRAPWLTALVTLVLATTTIALLAWRASLPDPPGRVWVRHRPPPSMEAYLQGGRPLPDVEINQLLAERLPDLVLATNRQVLLDARGDAPPPAIDEALARATAELLEEPAVARTGHPAWAGFTAALDEWRRLPRSIGMAANVSDKARALSRALAGAGVGYYLDAEVLEFGERVPAVTIYAYVVEEVSFVRRGAQTTRILHLRRLDRLNVERAALGMQSKELGDPLVLIEPVQAEVVDVELPTLAEPGGFPLVDPDLADHPDVAALIEAASTAIRAELLTALGADGARAMHAAARWRARQDAATTLERRVRGDGMELELPDDLFLPPDLFRRLHRRVPDDALRALADAEDALIAADAARLAVRLEDLLIGSVRLHEAQHGFDEGLTLPLPAALEARVGPLAVGDEDRPRAMSAHAELSAYLSQIASEPRTPHRALWGLVRHALDPRSARTVPGVVATLVIEELAVAIGAQPRDELELGPPLARRALPLASLSGEALRVAAAATWARLFGQPYVPLEETAAP